MTNIFKYVILRQTTKKSIQSDNYLKGYIGSMLECLHCLFPGHMPHSVLEGMRNNRQTVVYLDKKHTKISNVHTKILQKGYANAHLPTNFMNYLCMSNSLVHNLPQLSTRLLY